MISNSYLHCLTKKNTCKGIRLLPTSDLIPTNLFLVLFFAETLVEPPTFLSFSSTVSSAIFVLNTADHFHLLMLRSRLVGQYKIPTADCGLRTADHGLGIKNGLGTKRGLRTEYKTRTMQYVYKNSFRKVKLRETECDWHKTVVPAPCLTHKTLPLAGHAVYSPQSQRNAEKESILYGQGRLCLYSSQLKKKI